jgi:hypothetical protein
MVITGITIGDFYYGGDDEMSKGVLRQIQQLAAS